MPRNGSGFYTLPAGNPVVDNTTIESTWANPTMSDFAVQFNNVITRDGILGPSAPIKFQDGAVGAPGITFPGSTTTGFYRTTSLLGISYAGVLRFSVGSTGAAVVGDLAVSNDATLSNNLVVVGNANVASINGGPVSGLRNFFINGLMKVAQRGNVSFTATNNLYGGADRWFASISGTTVSSLLLQTPYVDSISGFAQQIGNVTTTGATVVALTQRIEGKDTTVLNGRDITISGVVQQNTGAAIDLSIVLSKANSFDDFNSGTTALDTTVVSIPDGVPTPISVTYTLGATEASNGLQVRLGYISLGAQSNSQFYFADMQLIEGSQATIPEHRPIGLELSLCQRYYYAFTTSENIMCPWGSGTQILRATHHFPVAMRATPAIVLTKTGGTGTVATVSTDKNGFQVGASASIQDVVSYTWTANAEL